jgi:hypothetical protein
MMALISALIAWIYLRIGKRQNAFDATLVSPASVLEEDG